MKYNPVMEAVDVAGPLANVSFSCPWDTKAAYKHKTGISACNNMIDEVLIIVNKILIFQLLKIIENCKILVLEVEPEDVEMPVTSPVTSGK